jgi:hypothetical protein
MRRLCLLDRGLLAAGTLGISRPKPSSNAPNSGRGGRRTRYSNRIGGTGGLWPAGPRRAAVNFETEPTRIAFTQGFDVPQEDDQLNQRQAGRQVPSGIRVIGNKYDSYIFIVLS